MNKIFTLLTFAAFSAAASAQTLTATFNGQPVENGATVYSEIKVVDGDAISEPETYVTSDEDIACSVKATTDNPEYVFFCPNQQCLNWTGNEIETPNKSPLELKAGVPVNMGIHYQKWDATETPTSSINVKFSYKIRPIFEFTIVFSANKAGIDNVDTNGNFVNLAAGNILEYNLPQATKLDIYSLNGATVMERTVNGHGSLSLDRLAPGVYLYKAGELTGKVLVK